MRVDFYNHGASSMTAVVEPADYKAAVVVCIDDDHNVSLQYNRDFVDFGSILQGNGPFKVNPEVTSFLQSLLRCVKESDLTGRKHYSGLKGIIPLHLLRETPALALFQGIVLPEYLLEMMRDRFNIHLLGDDGIGRIQDGEARCLGGTHETLGALYLKLLRAKVKDWRRVCNEILRLQSKATSKVYG